MKVVGHETVAVDLPACFQAALLEGAEKAMAILVVAEDRLTVVASVHNVIDGARILNAEFPNHSLRIANQSSTTVSIEKDHIIIDTFPFRFVEGGGSEAVITCPDKLSSALDGRTGTRVVP
jgi:hypothetical protein